MCRVTNPHDFEVDGVHFLGSAGQNVDDVYRWDWQCSCCLPAHQLSTRSRAEVSGCERGRGACGEPLYTWELHDRQQEPNQQLIRAESICRPGPAPLLGQKAPMPTVKAAQGSSDRHLQSMQGQLQVVRGISQRPNSRLCTPYCTL